MARYIEEHRTSVPPTKLQFDYRSEMKLFGGRKTWTVEGKADRAMLARWQASIGPLSCPCWKDLIFHSSTSCVQEVWSLASPIVAGCGQRMKTHTPQPEISLWQEKKAQKKKIDHETFLEIYCFCRPLCGSCESRISSIHRECTFVGRFESLVEGNVLTWH